MECRLFICRVTRFQPQILCLRSSASNGAQKSWKCHKAQDLPKQDLLQSADSCHCLSWHLVSKSMFPDGPETYKLVKMMSSFKKES